MKISKLNNTSESIRHELYDSFIQAFYRPVVYFQKEIVIKQEKKADNNKNITQPMETKELMEAIIEKNNLLALQAKRIKLLEEKMTTMRRKYFHLKYASIVLH